MAYYLDTSALVKLVSAETETSALWAWVRSTNEPLVTSDLARTELRRAVRRRNACLAPSARTVLSSLTILTLPTELFESAACIEPAEIRSLDALHLAAALHLGDDLSGFVVYDQRLAYAATRYGIHVLAPGETEREPVNRR